MQTLIGTLLTGDFKENTMTFEVEGDFTLRAGKYALTELKNHASRSIQVVLSGILRDIQSGKITREDAGKEICYLFGSSIEKEAYSEAEIINFFLLNILRSIGEDKQTILCKSLYERLSEENQKKITNE